MESSITLNKHQWEDLVYFTSVGLFTIYGNNMPEKERLRQVDQLLTKLFTAGIPHESDLITERAGGKIIYSMTLENKVAAAIDCYNDSFKKSRRKASRLEKVA